MDIKLDRNFIDEIVRKSVEDKINMLHMSSIIEEQCSIVAEQKISDLLDDKWYEGSKLERDIETRVDKGVVRWIENNLSTEDIMDIVKSAVVNRLEKLPVEELVGMLKVVK